MVCTAPGVVRTDALVGHSFLTIWSSLQAVHGGYVGFQLPFPALSTICKV